VFRGRRFPPPSPPSDTPAIFDRRTTVAARAGPLKQRSNLQARRIGPIASTSATRWVFDLYLLPQFKTKIGILAYAGILPKHNCFAKRSD
jgi:hypothetical protein